MVNSTNEMIRQTAFIFFLEKGYEGTKIRGICEVVDIKASSLYFYYKSKEELFFSIYDDICSQNLKCRQDTMEAYKTAETSIKLYQLYKSMIIHCEQDIVKQKFLLRYHLFPPEEIKKVILEKHKYWSVNENSIILGIINECLERKLLSDNRYAIDYLQEYLKIEKAQINEMIISNIKMSSAQLRLSWNRFWNSLM